MSCCTHFSPTHLPSPSLSYCLLYTLPPLPSPANLHCFLLLLTRHTRAGLSREKTRDVSLHSQQLPCKRQPRHVLSAGQDSAGQLGVAGVQGRGSSRGSRVQGIQKDRDGGSQRHPAVVNASRLSSIQSLIT